MKTKYYYLIACLSLLFLFSACSDHSQELKVLQMNIWHEGREVEGGFEAIGNEIARLNADVVLFSEIRNRNNKEFIPRIIAYLEEKGYDYYGESCLSLDVGVISKYPILEQRPNYPEGNKVGSVLKSKIKVDDKIVVIYSAHLDYTNYACFFPRGYSGTTWEKLEAPVLNSDSVEIANRLSLRDEAIQGVMDDVAMESPESIIILGGDFNEPSHLDWQTDTKNLYDHNGVIVNWDCSVLLTEYGFIDSFREKYPSAVTHPGFTFPSDNKSVDVSKLAWAPEVDERDRIDFIYYLPNKQISLQDITIVGPSQSIIRGQRAKSDSEDVFNLPQGIWPTDHKALLATFNLK